LGFEDGSPLCPLCPLSPLIRWGQGPSYGVGKRRWRVIGAGSDFQCSIWSDVPQVQGQTFNFQSAVQGQTFNFQSAVQGQTFNFQSGVASRRCRVTGAGSDFQCSIWSDVPHLHFLRSRLHGKLKIESLTQASWHLLASLASCHTGIPFSQRAEARTTYSQTGELANWQTGQLANWRTRVTSTKTKAPPRNQSG